MDAPAGIQPVATLPAGVKVVGMANHGGAVIVATSAGVYRLADGELVPVRFASALVEAPPRQPSFQFRGFWRRVWNR